MTSRTRGGLRVVGQRGLRRRTPAPAPAARLPRPTAAPAGPAPRRARSPGGRRTAARSPPTRPPTVPRSVHGQLRIQRAGKAVELAGAGHHVQHVGEVGHRAHAVGKGLQLLHELGVLDLVERAAAVGQLHAGLQFAVALAGAPAAPSRRCRRSGLRCRRAWCRRGAWAAGAPAPVSPLTGASSDSGTMASISASSRGLARRGGAQLGAPARVGRGLGVGAARRPRRSAGSTRCGQRRLRRVGLARAGAARAPPAVRQPAPASTHAAQDRQRDGQASCATPAQAASARPTRGFHVHRHDARHALLLHGHADQLLGHFHRDLVVADEQELRALRSSRVTSLQ